MTLPVMWNWGCFLGAFFGVTVRLVCEPAAGAGSAIKTSITTTPAAWVRRIAAAAGCENRSPFNALLRFNNRYRCRKDLVEAVWCRDIHEILDKLLVGCQALFNRSQFGF